jgi:hypothetical protein
MYVVTTLGTERAFCLETLLSLYALCFRSENLVTVSSIQELHSVVK